ncbi:unnamed protein product [Protopolystoma xenopodis]|uniref:Uncharacterized protein n=1 Tax=Protopolystoma xenopodis TaxID=117903 RepID=A0A448WFJ4_9PLAT|nr:unnamed protein product [Protopolystoma xenopodis]
MSGLDPVKNELAETGRERLSERTRKPVGERARQNGLMREAARSVERTTCLFLSLALSGGGRGTGVCFRAYGREGESVKYSAFGSVLRQGADETEERSCAEKLSSLFSSVVEEDTESSCSTDGLMAPVQAHRQPSQLPFSVASNPAATSTSRASERT